MERRDASRVLSPSSHDSDEVAVVQEDANEHADGVEGDEAGRGDLEVRAHVAVERGALFDEEGVYLNMPSISSA